MKKTILDKKFTLNIGVMQEVIEKVLNLKSTLDKYRPIDKETEMRIMQKFKLDWNYHSNNIEGNVLTYGETKALLLHGITAQGKPLKDHFEITGHNEAIDWVLEIVNGDRPLTENFIKQIHEILLKEPYEVDAITSDGSPTKKMIKVGQYKSTPNHVKTKTGEIFYFATPEETPSQMNDLIDWYREKESTINPVILAAEFHYKFIRIHPFDDGNGRVARLLMNFILMKNGYPPVIIKTEDKENYFSALQQADAGSIDAFIKYISTNLIHSLELMIRGANGESVEEPDDVLKELKLIEKRIEQIAEDDSRQVKKSKRVLESVYKDSLVPLFNEIQIKLRSVVSLFDQHNTRILAKGSEKGSIERVVAHPDWNEVADQFSNIGRSPNTDYTIEYTLSNFKKIKDSTDKFEVKLTLYFSDHHFHIGTISAFQSDPVSITVPYSNVLTKKQASRIGDALLKEFVKRIKVKMDSED